MFADEAEIKQTMVEMYRLLVSKGVATSLAQDLVQEAIIKAWQYEKEIPKTKQKAFVFKIVMNEFYMHYRKHKRLVLQEDVTLGINLSHLVEDWLLEKETQGDVREVLARLSPNYQQLLMMKYDLELSYQGMADYLETTPAQIKTYLYRSRKAFAVKWEEYQNEKE